MRSIATSLVVVLSCALALTFASVPGRAGAAAPNPAASGVPGNAVLAKPSGDALIIWDASPVVIAIVTGKIPDAAADSMLERDAVRVIASMTPLLDASTKSVTVRVTYSKTGAVSPIYGNLPFAGIELYATLKAPAADVLAAGGAWRELGAKDALPAWFDFKVVGALPPRA